MIRYQFFDPIDTNDYVEVTPSTPNVFEGVYVHLIEVLTDGSERGGTVRLSRCNARKFAKSILLVLDD